MSYSKDSNNSIDDIVELIMRQNLYYENGKTLKEDDLRQIIDDNRIANFFKTVVENDVYEQQGIESVGDLYNKVISKMGSYIEERKEELKNFYEFDDFNARFMDYESMRKNMSSKIDEMTPYAHMAYIMPRFNFDVSEKMQDNWMTLLKDSFLNRISILDLADKNVKSDKYERYFESVVNINSKLDDAILLETYNKYEPETIIRLDEAIEKKGFRLDVSKSMETNINHFLETSKSLIVEKNEKNIVASLINYASEKKLSVPERTQERWVELLQKGEKVENIVKYIDDYSKSIDVPKKENVKESVEMDI